MLIPYRAGRWCLLGQMLSIILILMSCSSGKPAVAMDPAAMATAIASDEWIFTARDASPSGGRTQILTSPYDLRLHKDSVYCYLPYFGRSFSGAGAMQNQNPMDFKTTDFSIEKEPLKKGGWRVVIRPRDVQRVQSLNFSLYDNGNAILQATLTDNTPISYNGNIRPLR